MDISQEIWTNYIKILFLYHTLVVVRPTNILQEGAISPQTSSKIQNNYLVAKNPTGGNYEYLHYIMQWRVQYRSFQSAQNY